MNQNPISYSEIRTFYTSQDPDKVWECYSAWIKTLLPFWEKAVKQISELINFDESKTEKHVKTIQTAFEYMDNWHFKRIKYVQARRNEIDSAISFIRNHAADTAVRDYWFAPVCRNVAQRLRICLYIASYAYSPKQIPECITSELPEIAATWLCLPFDTGSFSDCLSSPVHYFSDDPEEIEKIGRMYQNAARCFYIEREVVLIHIIVNSLWKMNNPVLWEMPDFIWDHLICDETGQLYTCHLERIEEIYK